ncbi:MAG: hypothetical protein H6677_12990 [Candidatus Obscuribacterales bacterium]|nr:hypothetical protein [Cyanobacteria bacterium HKST-UBA01]MCB9469183.1 hypothetical protein [Candidatus Obscuribacterales bacterium]
MEYFQILGTALLVSGTALGVLDALPGDNPVKLKDLNDAEREPQASHAEVLDLLFKMKVD